MYLRPRRSMFFRGYFFPYLTIASPEIQSTRRKNSDPTGVQTRASWLTHASRVWYHSTKVTPFNTRIIPRYCIDKKNMQIQERECIHETFWVMWKYLYSSAFFGMNSVFFSSVSSFFPTSLQYIFKTNKEHTYLQ